MAASGGRGLFEEAPRLATNRQSLSQKRSQNDERGLYPRRKRRNGRGGRATRSAYLNASEFGDGLRTGGVGQRDGGMARRLQRCASDRGRWRTSSRCRGRLS